VTLVPPGVGSALMLLALGCQPSTAGNVVDPIVTQLLAGKGMRPVLEDDSVLCRRMAIDLTGVPPTPDEIDARCVHHSPREIATYFMEKTSGAHVPDGSPPYVWVNRRFWADRFQYQSTLNVGTTWYTYVRDLDQLVGDLYQGKIRYDEFTRRALGSPAFARRFGVFETQHDLTLLASQAYRIFLGREPVPSEAADFGNLWRAWSTLHWDTEAAREIYPDCPVLYQAGSLLGCEHYELGIDGSACAGGERLACQSSVLGAAEVVPSIPFFVRWYDLSAGDLAALERPGALLVARRELADAAVDRALEKYLGWWKAAPFRPDSDVPQIRDRLTQKFITDGYDIRKLELEIVTSLLYTQRAEQVPGRGGASPPMWASGPTKMLYAEAWLDSVGQATGKALGGCDFRFDDTAPQAFSSAILIRYSFPTTPDLGPSFYGDVAQGLGGCPIASPHGSPAGLVPSVTRRVALAQICPGAFTPPAGSSLKELIALEYRGVGRSPTADETAVWMKALTDATEGGCTPNGACDLTVLATQLCQSLFATAEFNYY
jgi:hypothetical protein